MRASTGVVLELCWFYFMDWNIDLYMIVFCVILKFLHFHLQPHKHSPPFAWQHWVSKEHDSSLCSKLLQTPYLPELFQLCSHYNHIQNQKLYLKEKQNRSKYWPEYEWDTYQNISLHKDIKIHQGTTYRVL